VSITGTAELGILNETYRSIEVAIGPSPRDYTMDIDLTQASFANGSGFVRITSGDGDIEASAHVVLRLGAGVGNGHGWRLFATW